MQSKRELETKETTIVEHDQSINTEIDVKRDSNFSFMIKPTEN
jgi:hypothetical protein